MLIKFKKILMVLLLMVIPSISLVKVSADEVENYYITTETSVANDIKYLGFASYVNDNSLEVITFATGINKEEKMSIFCYIYSENDLSLYDITFNTTSLTDGVSSFSDCFSFVAKDDKLYKFVFKHNNFLNSLQDLLLKNTQYEFNIDCLIIGDNIFNELNGGYFEQRFYIERKNSSVEGVYSYYVKAINNVVVKVDADVGVRRLEDEKNFFNSVLFSDEVRDLFYICFDVYLNENKVLYDFYQIDLEYDVEYVKFVQNVDDWDNPIHVSLSKTVLESNHYNESITSKDKVVSFKKYNWFGLECDWFADVSVSFNTLSTMDYAKSNNYLADGFSSDKSYVLFFGNVDEGYKYSKGSVIYVPDCSYTFNYDSGVVAASSNPCSHIDVYEYRPKNVEFVTLYYRVNGFEYSIDVDEQYIENLGVDNVGPGSNVEVSGGIAEQMKEVLVSFFKPFVDGINSIVDSINSFIWIIYIVIGLILVALFWNPLTAVFKLIWNIIKLIFKIICLPFKLIGMIFKKIFKKKEYSNKVDVYQDKGGW